jgi:hypothetical protein
MTYQPAAGDPPVDAGQPRDHLVFYRGTDAEVAIHYVFGEPSLEAVLARARTALPGRPLYGLVDSGWWHTTKLDATPGWSQPATDPTGPVTIEQRCLTHADKMQEEGWYTTANVLAAAAETIALLKGGTAAPLPLSNPLALRALAEAASGLARRNADNQTGALNGVATALATSLHHLATVLEGLARKLIAVA